MSHSSKNTKNYIAMLDLFGHFLYHRAPFLVDNDGGFLLTDRPAVIQKARESLFAELRVIETYVEILQNTPDTIVANRLDSIMTDIGQSVGRLYMNSTTPTETHSGAKAMVLLVRSFRKRFEMQFVGMQHHTNVITKKAVVALMASCQTDEVRNLLEVCLDHNVTEEVEGQ